LTSMSFCQWYAIANSNVTDFKINTSGLKLIVVRMRKKVKNKYRENRKITSKKSGHVSGYRFGERVVTVQERDIAVI